MTLVYVSALVGDLPSGSVGDPLVDRGISNLTPIEILATPREG